MVRIPAGDITNLHYNFVVAKPLVDLKEGLNKIFALLILNSFCVKVVCSGIIAADGPGLKDPCEREVKPLDIATNIFLVGEGGVFP